jgi:hypothetical protein
MQLYDSSDKYFKTRTGRSFSEWKKVLDGWNALDKGHTEMSKYLSKEKGVNPDWAEAIAIRYQKEAYL